MRYFTIFLMCIMFASLSLFSQNVKVKIKTSVQVLDKILTDNQTVFYDASNYPFIKEVAVKLKKDSVISIPKGKYIVKADYPDFTFTTSSDEYFYQRHFLAEQKSLWDATIFNIENDTTLTEILTNPFTDYNADGSLTKFSILNNNNDTIKSVILTVFQSTTDKNQPYIYSSTAMYINVDRGYSMVERMSKSFYLLLFDYSGEYLPGYLADDSTVTQDFSQAKLFKISKNFEKHLIKMEKVVPPNGEFKIRGILDSTVLKIINKNESDAQLQSNMPIKWGIVVAYNENNQPVGFALTDAEGKFEIGKLTAGKYSIKANYLSMQKVVTTEIDNLGNTKDLNLTLDISDENEEFKIFPNPTNGICELNFKLSEADHNQIIIADINGNELYKFTTEFTDEINCNLDLSSYSQGVYNLIIKNGNNTYSRKILKN